LRKTDPGGTVAKGLLLDVGVVLFRSAWELLGEFEAWLGLEPGTLPWRGALDPAGDPLWQPGLQDISAFVDFTALAEAGDACGFERVSYSSQAAFLIAAGLEAAFAEGYAAAADETTRYALSNQVKRLTLPGEMGERFQTMLFSRGLDSRALFAPLIKQDRSDRL